jgi:hypothetical protein
MHICTPPTTTTNIIYKLLVVSRGCDFFRFLLFFDKKSNNEKITSFSSKFEPISDSILLTILTFKTLDSLQDSMIK